MDQLSSCYFCGAALDASLDEYPVVPKSLHPSPDDQQTVVLCQGCREKLGTVVETVVAAVDSTAGTGNAPAADAPTTADTADSPADEGWGELGEGAQGDEADDDSTGSDDVTYTSSTAAGGRKAVSGEAESIRDDAGVDEDATDDGPTADDAADGDDAVDEGSDADPGAPSNGGAPDADDGPSLTALEYNKVMRLLQNREFPVDRAEIRTVAVNAYQISESEFDAVIDAAISRGLIAGEDGQFVDGS